VGKNRANPTDHAKQGTKRSLLTDTGGLLLAIEAGGANRNEFKVAAQTLEKLEAARPGPSRAHPQGMCLDKDYDRSEIRELLEFTAHIRARGEEAQSLKRKAGAKARRWVLQLCPSSFPSCLRLGPSRSSALSYHTEGTASCAYRKTRQWP
jgi:hypothetical protein